jgi:hypothetical protein
VLGGFIEGEGSFNVSITPNSRMALKVSLVPEFSVTQHLSGLACLKMLRSEMQGHRYY